MRLIYVAEKRDALGIRWHVARCDP